LPEDTPQGLCPLCLIGAALAAFEQTRAHGSRTGDDPDEMTDPSEGRIEPSGSRGSTGAEEAPATVRYFGDYEIQAEVGREGKPGRS
jgi:hypothetical protein